LPSKVSDFRNAPTIDLPALADFSRTFLLRFLSSLQKIALPRERSLTALLRVQEALNLEY
jgi:hypothetical protein